MKIFKKALSITLALSVLLVTFSFLSAVTVSAVGTEYVIDEQITLTFNNEGKGWSGSNQSGGQLTQVDDSTQNGNKYMKFTSTNNSGYNMELASGDNSNSAYILEPNTVYAVKYDLKVVSASTNAKVHVSTGTKAAYDPNCSKATFGSVSLADYNDGEWHTITKEFTTTETMLASSYASTAKNNYCDKLYIISSDGTDGATVYVDNVVITKYKKATTSQTNSTTIDFNTTGKGWADTNLDSVEQVADPNNSNNKFLKLYCSDANGKNLALADGSNSTTAYVLEKGVQYSISFDVMFEFIEPQSGTLSSVLNILQASQTKAGGIKKLMTSCSLSNYTTGVWGKFNETFTTSNDDATLLLLNLQFSNCYAYIDNVIITKYKEASAESSNSTTIDFNVDGKGWADTNLDSVEQVADPNNSNNKYLKLYCSDANGKNLALADGSNSTTAYVLEKGVQYSISFDVMFEFIEPQSGTLSSVLNILQASQTTAGGIKKLMTSCSLSNYTTGVWGKFNGTFTTSNDDATLLLLNLQFSNCYAYIDNVVITNASQGGGNNSGSGEHMKYTISDFTHKPYDTAVKGNNLNTIGYVSLRMYTDILEDGNSVYGYSYLLDLQSDLIEASNSGTGTRGDVIGTGGTGTSVGGLFPAENKAIELKQNQAYKLSFKYKVTYIEEGRAPYIRFKINRGLYQSSWFSAKDVGSYNNFFLTRYNTNDEWEEATYTFVADYTTDLDYKYLFLSMGGYGKCIMDDFVIEEIDASEVEPLPDTSNYTCTVTNGKATLTDYKGKEKDVTIIDSCNGIALEKIEYAFMYNDIAESITLSEGITNIGMYSFESAVALKKVTIPSTVTTIGKSVFVNTPSLKEIIVADNNANYKTVDGVLYNKNMTELIAYPSAKDDTTFTVPATVTKIAENAFNGAKNLKTIILPENLASIGKRAFINCTALTEIEIPDSVTEILASTFRGCVSLETVSLNEATPVGEHAFLGCVSLFAAGNVDMDDQGKINIRDTVSLMRHISDWDGYEFDRIQKMAADVNNDGKISTADAVILLRHIADWDGYKKLPCAGKSDEYHTEYTTDSTDPEVVVNFDNIVNNRVDSNRDIEYDENKEDVIIVLVIGQSNSGVGGYRFEYEYKYDKNHPDWNITAEPARPAPGTVFSATSFKDLTSAEDVYSKTDPALGTSTMGGYTPALGKALNEATGAKVALVQVAKGATGMHEWVKDPENYKCTCGHSYQLYDEATKLFQISYRELSEKYNVILTGYIYNQGEHDEGYGKQAGVTINSAEKYYDALVSMHENLLADCELDFGGLYVPRSYYPNHGMSSNANDTVENSRRTSIARQAMYRASSETDKLFVLSNATEWMSWAGTYKPDPTNVIHYSQLVYNTVGEQCAANILNYTGITKAPKFTGIVVYNAHGVELATFNEKGELLTGSDIINITSVANQKLQIMIQPLGTFYTYDFTDNVTDDNSVINEFGEFDLTKLNSSTVKLVINTPNK